MKPSEYPEYLLRVFLNEYEQNEVVRQYGLYPWELTDKSRLRFGDAGDALAAVEQMRKRGWIAPLHGQRVRIQPSVRITMTPTGIDHARQLMRPRHARAFDATRGHLRSVIIYFVLPVLAGIAVYMIVRVLGWR